MSECGLLPITLTIAAQVVRSWGDGWEEAVLPLMREDQGASASTVEERVIGAGLQALEKHEDGAAVKELFHMFAVTQEDFVHPMAVIELLWRGSGAGNGIRGASSRVDNAVCSGGTFAANALSAQLRQLRSHLSSFASFDSHHTTPCLGTAQRRQAVQRLACTTSTLSVECNVCPLTGTAQPTNTSISI